MNYSRTSLHPLPILRLWHTPCYSPAHTTPQEVAVAHTAHSHPPGPLATLPVPPYLPTPARTLLPWTRTYVAQTTRRYELSLSDAWDEALTALLRAATFFRPGPASFASYAQTAVRRALWRYCTRAHLRKHHRNVPLPPSLPFTEPSPETIFSTLELALLQPTESPPHARTSQSRA
jgi:hypothetical protein